MTTPPVTMGYRSPASTNDTTGVYIQVFVTVHPPLGVLPPLTGSVRLCCQLLVCVCIVCVQFDSCEDAVLLHKASVWLTAAQETHTHRNYQVTDYWGRGRVYDMYLRHTHYSHITHSHIAYPFSLQVSTAMVGVCSSHVTYTLRTLHLTQPRPLRQEEAGSCSQW